jgi:hypothetical protein
MARFKVSQLLIKNAAITTIKDKVGNKRQIQTRYS